MSQTAVLLMILHSMLLFACNGNADRSVRSPGAHGVISAQAGGSVRLEDATLWVPAGSLATDTEIGLSPLEALPAVTEAGRFKAVGQAYELTPHGTEFALAFPAVLSVIVDRAAMTARGLDPRTAQVFHFDEETGLYVGVASTFDDRTGMLISAIEHFSKYVVMAQTAAATAPGPTVVLLGTTPATVRAGAPLYLRATVVPSVGTSIASVRVYYRKLQPGPQPTIEAVMTPDRTPTVPASNTYGFLVPASFLTTADLGPGADIAYYAEATDSLGVTTSLAATPITRDVTVSYVSGSLAVAPGALNISAGFERWLTVTATDSAAITFQVIPDSTAVSTCAGPPAQPLGEIDDHRASGIHFRALRACAGALSVSLGTDVRSIPVTVGAGRLESIVLYRYEQVGPAEIRTEFDGTYSLPEGHSVELDALGRDGFGNTTIVNVTWTADPSIGTMDASGRLYALDGAGFGRVNASVGGVGGVSASQWFNVVERAWNTVGTFHVSLLNRSTGTLAAWRYFHTATLLPSGRVLVIGGSNPDIMSASTELYDPVTNTWAPTGSMGSDRYVHTATLLPSGKVLVTGGLRVSSPSILAGAEIYDPGTNAWIPAGTMGSARHKHTATMLSSGKVLVTGGSDSNGFLSSAELYDPVTNTWAPASSMGSARHFHTATLLPSGQVLVTGGLGVGYSTLASAEIYDPATNTWASADTMGSARSMHVATLLTSGQVLVTGGVAVGAMPLEGVELYDPLANAWAPAATMGSARRSHTATLLPSGQVLVTGGFTDNSGTMLASAELYDSGIDVWAPASTMAAHRGYHTATVLPSGRVLVAGGIGYNYSPIASAELFFAGPIEPSMAFFGSTPYIAWHERSEFSRSIHVSHWSGSAWIPVGSSPLNVDPTREATAPKIAFAGAVPYIAWQEAGAAASQIYVKRWNGAAWVQDAAGSLNVDASKHAAAPAIAIAGTTPYVAWEEQEPSAKQVYVRRWNGTSWAQLGGSLGVSPARDATRASIAVMSTTPYVAWEQQTASGTHTIHVKHWTGFAWVADGPSLNANPAADAREPMIAIGGGVPYVTWRETLSDVTEVYVAHWTGTAWVRDGGSLSNDSSRSITSPVIAFSGTTPYVAWREYAAGAYQIYVKHLNGATWIQNGASLTASTAATAFAPSLAFNGATPYASWSEFAGSLYSIKLKRLE